MTQHECPKCGGNIRTIGTLKGAVVYCRHCREESITKRDNL